ncbi:MAG TPA: VWA domain-containing protein, partial [Candidatus Methylacidiphilales bacterium]|nr:VWA domain-containing protein [Candidatus Methylacidiphilales bacterium]
VITIAILRQLGTTVTSVFAKITTNLQQASGGDYPPIPSTYYVTPSPVNAPPLPMPSRVQEIRRRETGRVPSATTTPTTPQPSSDTSRETPPAPTANTETYDSRKENPFLDVRGNPLSTFGIDVDTASYSNVRRYIMDGTLPPAGAVRVEEMINYFPYNSYMAPSGDSRSQEPFATNVEIADCPWNPAHRLVRIGIKGKTIDASQREGANFVFLVDVSGSMDSDNKLPLVKKSLRMLVNNLQAKDRIAIVVYAGKAGLVLPSTSCSDRSTILSALDNLQAGGSTAGGAGISLAYKVAADNFIPGGINRVILTTDGDFNVGVSDNASLVELIRQKAKSGVFLTVLGYGMGNYKDSTMQQIADNGNGNSAYIDNLMEANKVLVEQAGGTLITIAKDVKIQVEFNPARVAGYRLIGYEKRLLAKEDFNDDTKDAGEIGAGHTVTALYQVVPAGLPLPADVPPVDELKYQRSAGPAPTPTPMSDPGATAAPALTSTSNSSDELMTLKIRYKTPGGHTSERLDMAIRDAGNDLAHATPDFRFASSVALFGMVLQDSRNVNGATLETVYALAKDSAGNDSYRHEFVQLVNLAKSLKR